MNKNLSELFTVDINAEGRLAIALRNLQVEYIKKVEETEASIEEEYKNKPTDELNAAKFLAMKNMNFVFCVNAAATIRADHGISELIDDMPEDSERPFPIAAYILEPTQ